MNIAQRDSARKKWREMYRDYMTMRTYTIKIILHPEATVEHVMLAKDMLCESHKNVYEVQASLDRLNVLGFRDPRLP